jgi:hypothetical protein
LDSNFNSKDLYPICREHIGLLISENVQKINLSKNYQIVRFWAVNAGILTKEPKKILFFGAFSEISHLI